MTTKPGNAKFDLANLDTVAAADKGAEIELLHPFTKEPLGMFISVVGTDSSIYKEYNQEVTNGKIRNQQMLRKAGKDLPTITVEQQEAEGIELLVACTVGFRNIEFNGPLEFSHANAKKLYVERPWVRHQVDSAIADVQNFMKNLPKI